VGIVIEVCYFTAFLCNDIALQSAHLCPTPKVRTMNKMCK
jgi:hypothetical protein